MGEARLLPCPFCGGEVELVPSRVVGDSDWIRHVDRDCGLLEFSNFNAGGDVAELWNTRA